MDWSTIITELANAERAPETQWEAQQTTYSEQNSAFGTIQSYLDNLQADVQKLQDPSLYTASSATTSDSTIATVSAANGATNGTFSFDISQLATATKITGTSNISESLVPDGNPADVTIGTAGFSSPVTAGTFTINGQQITISQSDSLQQVFNNIATATSNAVTASYNSSTDEITLSSSSPITLGSAADTSNFLQIAQLYNNGDDTVSSSNALGHANLNATLADAGLATTISDGGSGAGQLTINGVAISYDASTDTLQDLLNRINSSGAGVTATYDALNNRFVLQNQTTGNVGISMQDNTGNFLAATGLSGGTTTNGQNLLYTLNGNTQQLQSQSNTITSDSSTITGLSVTALKTGTVSVSVANDTSGVTTALQSFVTDYNNVQSYITTQTASTTSSTGTVTPGLLTGDLEAEGIATDLRNSAFSSVSVANLPENFSLLADFGITSNGNDNTITLDTATLSAALSNNLTQVQSFFSDSTNGWGENLNNYLNNTIGTSGSLPAHEATITAESKSINTQISNLEAQVTSDTNMWTTEFQNMETAESQTNQELTYLSQSVSNGSL